MHGNHLTPLRIKKLTEPGRYADGNCLYLVVSDRGSKRWILRFVVKGRRRDMGLGSASLINLDEARDLARKYRRMAKLGIDPLIERRKTQAAFLTLKEAAIKVHALNLPSWKNKKHSEQWITSLQRHVFPKSAKSSQNGHHNACRNICVNRENPISFEDVFLSSSNLKPV